MKKDPPPPGAPLTESERVALLTGIAILAEYCEDESRRAFDVKKDDIGKRWLAEKTRVEAELPGLVEHIERASKAQTEEVRAGLGLFLKRLKGAAGTMRGIGKLAIAQDLDAELETLKVSLPPRLADQQSLPLTAGKPAPTSDDLGARRSRKAAATPLDGDGRSLAQIAQDEIDRSAREGRKKDPE